MKRVDERVGERVGERVDGRVGQRVGGRVGERVDERVDERGERVGEPNFIENRSLTVIGLASVISNCNGFSFKVASVTLEKEPTVLQRIEIRFPNASDVASKSVGRSNCVANYQTTLFLTHYNPTPPSSRPSTPNIPILPIPTPKHHQTYRIQTLFPNPTK